MAFQMATTQNFQFHQFRHLDFSKATATVAKKPNALIKIEED